MHEAIHVDGGRVTANGVEVASCTSPEAAAAAARLLSEGS